MKRHKNFKAFTESQAKDLLEKYGVIDRLVQGNQKEISANYSDLAHLYLVVRERKPFSILEFGSGFSTIVMAYALKQNWDEYHAIAASPQY
jgi:predicted O-methyltransferase YrrM